VSYVEVEVFMISGVPWDRSQPVSDTLDGNENSTGHIGYELLLPSPSFIAYTTTQYKGAMPWILSLVLLFVIRSTCSRKITLFI
jgi:hypothetical protein